MSKYTKCLKRLKSGIVEVSGTVLQETGCEGAPTHLHSLNKVFKLENKSKHMHKMRYSLCWWKSKIWFCSHPSQCHQDWKLYSFF